MNGSYLSEHVLATSIVEDHAHGALRIGKTTRRRTKALKIDCAAALVKMPIAAVRGSLPDPNNESV